MEYKLVPADKEEFYPDYECPECEEGIITLATDGIWECNICNWHNPGLEDENDSQ